MCAAIGRKWVFNPRQGIGSGPSTGKETDQVQINRAAMDTFAIKARLDPEDMGCMMVNVDGFGVKLGVRRRQKLKWHINKV